MNLAENMPGYFMQSINGKQKLRYYSIENNRSESKNGEPKLAVSVTSILLSTILIEHSKELPF